MNSRKFYLVFCSIISVFLFIAGAFLLNTIYAADSSDDNSPSDSILSRFKPSTGPVNILVLGGDKVNKNTDTIMLVNFNPANFKTNILSIPRDTKVNVKGSSLPKINSAYPIGGARLAVDTVSGLLNVKIKYFIYIDTASFRKIVDLLGGVDYNIPADMDYDDPLQNLHIHLKKGQRHLDGEMAEQFMRFRHPTHPNKEINQYYDGSDLKRIDAQQNFIRELIRQKANIYYFSKLNNILSVVFSNIETNMKLEEILKLSQNIGKLSMSNILMFKVPGQDSNESSAWYYIMDKQKTNDIVNKYFIAKEGFKGSAVPAQSNGKSSNTGKSTKPAATTKSSNTNNINTTTKPSVTTDNPSNSDTSMKGTTGQNP